MKKKEASKRQNRAEQLSGQCFFSQSHQANNPPLLLQKQLRKAMPGVLNKRSLERIQGPMKLEKGKYYFFIIIDLYLTY